MCGEGGGGGGGGGGGELGQRGCVLCLGPHALRVVGLAKEGWAVGGSAEVGHAREGRGSTIMGICR